MRSLRISRLARGASLALLISFIASTAGAEAKAWDQKAVTALAVTLNKSLKDLHLTVQKTPQATVGSPTRRAQYNARESLKMLVTVSQRLAAQLQAGDDKDATLPTYKRLQTLRRDAEEDGKKANISAPTLEKVVSSQAVMEQLAPYYEDAPAAGASAPAP